MNSDTLPVRKLLEQARRGDRDALGKILENYRAYLRIMAQRHLDGRLAARIDASDLVQQTCLSAHRDFDRFVGDEEGQFLAWLGQIHEQNLRNVLRDHVGAEKRAAGRESSSDKLASVAAVTSSPSRRAMQGEDAVQLARCLEQLPPDQCNAVRLRHLEGWAIADIARELGRSEQAVAGLLKRGMQQLREMLPPYPRD
jgi:RNA polymerase sigma-70 factor (ECF subfamily)